MSHFNKELPGGCRWFQVILEIITVKLKDTDLVATLLHF